MRLSSTILAVLTVARLNSSPQFEHVKYGNSEPDTQPQSQHPPFLYCSSGENQEDLQAALCKYCRIGKDDQRPTNHWHHCVQEKIGQQCLYFSRPFQPWGITESWEEVSNVSHQIILPALLFMDI